jgi:two-component system LytT family response regulator
LLKPIREEELRVAIEKWKKYGATQSPDSQFPDIAALIRQLSNAHTGIYREHFLVKNRDKLLSIHTDQVAYFSSKDSLTFFITLQKQKFYVDFTLDELEKELNPKTFYRVNRQIIMARNLVVSLQPWFNGKLKLETKIPVEGEVIISRDKAAQVKQWLGGRRD